jgi:hypothetical protein
VLHLYFADTGLINHGLFFAIRAEVEDTVNDLNKRIGDDQLQIPLLTVHYLGAYETSIISDFKSNSKAWRNLSVCCVKRGKVHTNIHIYLKYVKNRANVPYLLTPYFLNLDLRYSEILRSVEW